MIIRLDVGADAGLRVEEEECGRENTRGTTNRCAVCVSPAPEEKKKKRDATTANKKQPDNREKRGTQESSSQGRVLKG